MAKPEWGAKRTCQNCGARFYDLKRDPIVCPKCDTVFDPLASLRPRRSRVPAGAESPAKGALEPEDAKLDHVEVEGALADEEVAGIEKDDDDGVIEDASELGEDDDGMSDVGVDDEDEQ